MIIIVNCNDDTLTLVSESIKSSWKIKEPNLILKIFEEVLNQINEKNLVDYYGVTLEKIDEDTRSTVGEW